MVSSVVLSRPRSQAFLIRVCWIAVRNEFVRLSLYLAGLSRLHRSVGVQHKLVLRTLAYLLMMVHRLIMVELDTANSSKDDRSTRKEKLGLRA